MASRYSDQSSPVTAFGLLIAVVAVVETQFLGRSGGPGNSFRRASVSSLESPSYSLPGGFWGEQSASRLDGR